MMQRTLTWAAALGLCQRAMGEAPKQIHESANQTQEASASRRPEGRTILRRLNRLENENTVRDLLAIDLELGNLLPADSSAEGFDNVGEAMHTSSFLMGKYLDAAERALDQAIANGPPPPQIKKRYSLKDQHLVNRRRNKSFAREMTAPW